MTRGPGSLGRRIIRELDEAPDHLLEWETLKSRFPLQVGDKSFYRAIRSLERMGIVSVIDEPEGSHPRRHVGLAAFAGGTDRELLDLLSAAYQQYVGVARARGVPISPSPAEVRRELAKRRAAKGSENTEPRA
jgi:hypothetical protein